MERIFYPDDIESIAVSLKGKEKIFILADANVAGFAHEFCRATGIKNIADIRFFHATEDNKSVSSILEIIGWLVGKEAGRDALLIGIGGGITTDITGFTASIYKRGIKYALVPTTLLAQTDAAIGGKTGINFGGLKNLLGTFSEPEWVYIDRQALQTLPERDFMSGAAEVLKTFIIGDAQMYRKTVETLKILCNKDNGGTGSICGNEKTESEFDRIIRRCVEIKAGIVEKDRKEKGLRMVLNLGHTLGHAAEAVMLQTSSLQIPATATHSNSTALSETTGCKASVQAPPPLTHGDAVAAGIIAAAEISAKAGILPYETLQTLTNDFKSLGYRTLAEIADSCASLSEEKFFMELSDFVRNDKKRKEDFINFVFIKRIGEVAVGRMEIRDLFGSLNRF